MKLKKSAAVAAGAIMAIGMATPAVADAEAEGFAAKSPGLLSGNVIQVPIHIPINACGNSINIVGALNPAGGNVCINK
ncbi:chaplin [Streptomyces torulosus]|uniref:chaplin n=1 Tax=Streptomyces torulosus TaxID=68276 RepID=UPI000AC9FC1B|nr:chaplin [Streptomyces torulosus]